MKNLKEFRKKYHLSQVAFADLLGVHWRTVQEWEAGTIPSKLAQIQIDRVKKNLERKPKQ